MGYGKDEAERQASNQRQEKQRQKYIDALKKTNRYRGKDTRLSKLKDEWSKYRKTYKSTTGENAPRLDTVAKEGINYIPTIDFGMEYINDFKRALETIYDNTVVYTQTANTPLAGIGARHNTDLYATMIAIEQEIDAYLNSDIPADIVAQAIADNVELDYTIAIAIIPPSDIQNLFEITLEQIQGLWVQINDVIEKRAQEMEAEYYGI